MKIAPTTYGGFYMKYLLVFACFFGSLLIDLPALAQDKSSWGGTRPDNKYGEGGTQWVDHSNGKVSTKWMDKDGSVREEYIHPEGDETSSGSWSFYNKDNEMVGTFSWKGTNSGQERYPAASTPISRRRFV